MICLWNKIWPNRMERQNRANTVKAYITKVQNDSTNYVLRVRLGQLYCAPPPIFLLKSVRIWGLKHSAAVPNIRIRGLKHSAAVPITLRRVRDVKSYLQQMRKKSAVNNQSYLHDFSLSLTGLLLRESTSNEHEIRLWCLVLTNLPTTFPRCRTSNTNNSGTRRLPSETANPAPAPYRGTLFPWRFTVTTRWLFLGW